MEKGVTIKSISGDFETTYYEDKKLETRKRENLREFATKTGKKVVSSTVTIKSLLKSLIDLLPNTSINNIEIEEFFTNILSNLWFIDEVLNNRDKDLINHYYLMYLHKKQQKEQ